MKAAKVLEVNGISTTVADARFAKPLDTGLIERAKVFPMTLPDRFIAHGSPVQQYTDAGLMSVNIVNTAMNMLSLGTEDFEPVTPLQIQKIRAAE